jgi:hypothetical protein
MHETIADSEAPESELPVIKGYWHYLALYDEEIHIVSVDGKRNGKQKSWPYAYSVSLPKGTHWVELAVLRNSNEIVRCAFEANFETKHIYKIKALKHNQLLLAHPQNSPFIASISLELTAPTKPVQSLSATATCAKAIMCRQNSDCPPSHSCQMNTAFDFGTCKPSS